jgi:hypothetical protein
MQTIFPKNKVRALRALTLFLGFKALCAKKKRVNGNVSKSISRQLLFNETIETHV